MAKKDVFLKLDMHGQDIDNCPTFISQFQYSGSKINWQKSNGAGGLSPTLFLLIGDGLTLDAAKKTLSAEVTQAELDAKQPLISETNKLPYSLISGTPTIPTVGNGKVTVTQNGKTWSFTMNQSGATTIELTDSNTTYSSLAAASGGTAVSLVTTGEKYTWNSKQAAISDLATIRTNAANGATAYGWGDHSKAGYLKSVSGSTFISVSGSTLTLDVDSQGGLGDTGQGLGIVDIPSSLGVARLSDTIDFRNTYAKTISNGEAGWYRIFVNTNADSGANYADLYVCHSYSYTHTEALHFTVSEAYGSIEFTQLNAPYINVRIKKVRVSRSYTNKLFTIDIYTDAGSTRDIYFVSGGGTGTLQTPTLVTTNTADVVKEFTLDNGFYINSKIKGTGFYKDGSSDEYVLLGGGGHKQEINLYAGSLKENRNGLLNAKYGDYGGILQDSTNGPRSGVWSNRIKILHSNEAGYYTELAQEFNGIENHLYFRELNNGSLSAWKTVVDSENFSNFASASSSKTSKYLARGGDTSIPMTFNWVGQEGQPTWLWGGEDGTNMYVYNPKNFNVSHSSTTYNLQSTPDVDNCTPFGVSYKCGQITKGTSKNNSYSGSIADYNVWSYPTSAGTSEDNGTANIMDLRFTWGKGTYYHDFFMTPNNNSLWHRSVVDSNSGSWYKIVQEDGGSYNISATKLNGYTTGYNDNKPWGKIPVITDTGWMEVGKHFEFHYDNTTGSDYSTILRCTGNYSNTVNLPSGNGTLALTSQIPTKVSQLSNDANYVNLTNNQGLIYTSTIIDASSLDVNTWYPVTLTLIAQGAIYHFEITNALETNVPSWSTHSEGFTCKKVWEVYGSGWGTLPNVNRTIYVSTYSYADKDPVRGIGQMTNSSYEYVYVRGGGKYAFQCSRGVVPVLKTSTFTYQNQTVAPTTTVPNEIVRDNQVTTDNISWSRIVSRPTTLSGYGITDAISTSGGKITGVLEIQADKGNWREGIRIYPYSNWSTIVLGGNDLTTSTGTSANTWSIHNNNGTFCIAKNGSDTNASAYLSHTNSTWSTGSSMTIKGNDLQIGNSGVANIGLLRPGYNYIWAETAKGVLSFGTVDSGVHSSANAALNISGKKVYVGGTESGTGVLNVNGDIQTVGNANRYMRLTQTSIELHVTASTGWATGLSVYGTENAFLGCAAGTYGSTNTLHYYYYGGEYNNANINMYSNGDIYFKGNHYFFFNRDAVGAYFAPVDNGVQLNMHNAAHAYTQSLAGFQTSSSFIASALKIGANSAPSYTLDVLGTIFASTGIFSSGYVSARGQDTSSDINLKTDFSPIKNALDYVLKTHYTQFKWKDTMQLSMGIIAQEEQNRDYGYLVKSHNDVGHLTYDYAASTALLGAAIQEEDSKVEALKRRVQELENEIKKLKEYAN
mgnify:CR=1 FL=1